MNDGKPIVYLESPVTLRDDMLKGRLEIPYTPGMGDHQYILTITSYISSMERHDHTLFRQAIRHRRRFTLNEKKKIPLAKVGPILDNDNKNVGVTIHESLRHKPSAKRLNRVSFVSKDTGPEDDNQQLILNMNSARSTNTRDLFNGRLFELEINLTSTLRRILNHSVADPIVIKFEINLNNKLNSSLSRDIQLVSNPNFDSKRDQLVQAVVYRRARTIGTYRHNFQDTQMKELIDSPKSGDIVSVRNTLSLSCDGSTIDKKELIVVENPSNVIKSQTRHLTGSLPYKKKCFFCITKKRYINFALSLSDNKLTDERQSLTFTFRAQYLMLNHFAYLDFKLLEVISKGEEPYNSITIHGSSAYLAWKQQPSHSAKGGESYFEFVGSIDFKDLEVQQHYSIYSSRVKVSHVLEVYLSNYPYTFVRKVGQFDIDICKVAKRDQINSMFPDDIDFAESVRKPDIAACL